MRFEIHGQNVAITDAMRQSIETKLSTLEKYVVFAEDTTAKVKVKIYPSYQKIEVTIPSEVGLLRAEAMHDDLYSAIDLAVDKLARQIRKHKTRLSHKHKEGLAEQFLHAEPSHEAEEVVRTKKVDPELMDLDEAILRMEMLGHTFFIYTDTETNQVAVVYKRDAGGYGLLET